MSAEMSGSEGLWSVLGLLTKNLVCGELGRDVTSHKDPRVEGHIRRMRSKAMKTILYSNEGELNGK